MCTCTCVYIAYYIKGVVTTISPHGFSVSLNERGLGGNPIEDAMAALLLHKARDPSLLLREVSIYVLDVCKYVLDVLVHVVRHALSKDISHYFIVNYLSTCLNDVYR